MAKYIIEFKTVDDTWKDAFLPYFNIRKEGVPHLFQSASEAERYIPEYVKYTGAPEETFRISPYSDFTTSPETLRAEEKQRNTFKHDLSMKITNDKSYDRWTATELSDIVGYFRSGFHSKDISEAMCRTFSTVSNMKVRYNKLCALGLDPHRPEFIRFMTRTTIAIDASEQGIKELYDRLLILNEQAYKY